MPDAFAVTGCSRSERSHRVADPSEVDTTPGTLMLDCAVAMLPLRPRGQREPPVDYPQPSKHEGCRRLPPDPPQQKTQARASRGEDEPSAQPRTTRRHLDEHFDHDAWGKQDLTATHAPVCRRGHGFERCLTVRILPFFLLRVEPNSERAVRKRTSELADDMRTSHGSNQLVLVGTDRAAWSVALENALQVHLFGRPSPQRGSLHSCGRPRRDLRGCEGGMRSAVSLSPFHR